MKTEELEKAIREANNAFDIATNVTENTGQPVKVNGISQLSTLRVLEAARHYHAILPLLEKLKLDADNAYCRFIDQTDKHCRGAEFKIANGEFTLADLQKHTNAKELYGRHCGLNQALSEIAKIVKGDGK